MPTKPIILYDKINSQEDLLELKAKYPVWKEIDFYKQQLEELFIMLHPPVKFASDFNSQFAKYIASQNQDRVLNGNWVYFPWSGCLMHLLPEAEFNFVKTNRNQNIITSQEQEKLKNFTVGFMGLSIGNGMALSTIYNGFSSQIKIADYDTLDLSNLNRIRAGVQNLGMSKIDITAQQIYEANPYTKIFSFDQGINRNNIESFFTQDPRPQIIFEAIDDFEIKIRTRIVAKKYKVPVIMLTNLGDRLMIDVERYDTDDSTMVFNGLIGDVAEEILTKPITEEDKQKYAVAIVGKQNIPERVLQTIGEINKTLVGRPQVMNTVTIGSGIAALLVRKIGLNQPLANGRTILDFSDLIK